MFKNLKILFVDFKNYKIKNLKIIIPALIVVALVFLGWNYSSASTIGSSQTAIVYGPSANTTLKTGLVGWWTFDGADTTAVTTTDKSGQGNNGTRTATTITPGKIGQAMKFGGVTGNRINIGYHSVLDIVGSKSISVWIKTSSFTQNGAVVANSGSGFGSIFFENALKWRGGDNGIQLTYTVPTSFQNKWIHIVATQIGTNAVLYVNGVAVLSNTNVTALIASAEKQAIGNLTGDAAGYAFNGSIDDVRIYSRALSATEAAFLYKLGQSKTASSQTAKPTTGNTLKTGLAGWWTFDGADVTANTTTDKAGTNNGTRSTTTIATGKVGQSMSFNGTNSYVEAPYSANLNPDTFTVAGWAKVTGGQGNYRSFVTSRKTSPGGGYIIYADASNFWQSWIYDSLGNSQTLTGPQVQIGKWVYVVTTYDGSVSKLYVNNILYATSAPFTLNKNTTRPLRIGAGATEGAPTFFFHGLIDDFRVYNRALSATEITALYKLGQTQVASSQTAAPTTGNALKNSLVGWWTMDGPDVTANTTTDKAGTNNGTRTATTITPGKIGQAMKFNGSSSKVALSSFATGANLTMSVWYKTSVIGGQRPIINNYGLSAGNGVYFGLTGAGALFSYSAGSNPTSMSGVKLVRANTWHHGVYTTDGATSTFYVDGVIDKQIAQTRVTGTSTAFIGYGGEAGDYWNGSLDDVRLYNRTLSATEITQLYKMGR